MICAVFALVINQELPADEDQYVGDYINQELLADQDPHLRDCHQDDSSVQLKELSPDFVITILTVCV